MMFGDGGDGATDSEQSLGWVGGWWRGCPAPESGNSTKPYYGHVEGRGTCVLGTSVVGAPSRQTRKQSPQGPTG
jgi:hypothetical protein